MRHISIDGIAEHLIINDLFQLSTTSSSKGGSIRVQGYADGCLDDCKISSGKIVLSGDYLLDTSLTIKSEFGSKETKDPQYVSSVGLLAHYVTRALSPRTKGFKVPPSQIFFDKLNSGDAYSFQPRYGFKVTDLLESAIASTRRRVEEDYEVGVYRRKLREAQFINAWQALKKFLFLYSNSAFDGKIFVHDRSFSPASSFEVSEGKLIAESEAGLSVETDSKKLSGRKLQLDGISGSVTFEPVFAADKLKVHGSLKVRTIRGTAKRGQNRPYGLKNDWEAVLRGSCTAKVEDISVWSGRRFTNSYLSLHAEGDLL